MAVNFQILGRIYITLPFIVFYKKNYNSYFLNYILNNNFDQNK